MITLITSADTVARLPATRHDSHDSNGIPLKPIMNSISRNSVPKAQLGPRPLAENLSFLSDGPWIDWNRSRSNTCWFIYSVWLAVKSGKHWSCASVHYQPYFLYRVSASHHGFSLAGFRFLQISVYRPICFLLYVASQRLVPQSTGRYTQNLTSPTPEM